MRRRDFVTLLGGASAWPLAAHAQMIPVVAFLSGVQVLAHLLEAFRRGLGEIGYAAPPHVAQLGQSISFR